MSTSKVHLKEVEDEEVARLVAESRSTSTTGEYDRILDELLDIYEAADNDATEADVRLGFLHVLQAASATLTADRFARFVAEEVTPSEFEQVTWNEPQEVVDFIELLYRFETTDRDVAQRIREHVHALLLRALRQFEDDGELEKMFELLQTAPTTEDLMDEAQMLRLRNRAYLYEMRRVRRNRRVLYAILLVQVVLIVIVFPLLFINAENGAIQAAIEEAAGVDMPEEAMRTYSFFDGVYWSLITAGSIGYGDITPLTRMGRIISAILGVMGVLTTGIVAGLILNWVSPRQLK
ncbi:MAG TPA: potassium channel family protein [Candidatus Sulfomarinibacteraceae bacterium]|nr:potassium channel family protein [Candidatus Sulfomarinibacteraceae bacterium]